MHLYRLIGRLHRQPGHLRVIQSLLKSVFPEQGGCGPLLRGDLAHPVEEQWLLLSNKAPNLQQIQNQGNHPAEAKGQLLRQPSSVRQYNLNAVARITRHQGLARYHHEGRL